MTAPSSLRLVVHGAAGRMGRRVIACSASDSRIALAAAIDRPGSPHLGEDSGTLAGLGENGVVIRTDWQGPADVIIDFSLPGGVAGIARTAAARGIPLVVATTGLDDADHDAGAGNVDASRFLSFDVYYAGCQTCDIATHSRL